MSVRQGRVWGVGTGNDRPQTGWTTVAIRLCAIAILIRMFLDAPQPQLDKDALLQLVATSHIASSPLKISSAPLKGILVAITGATSGIGLGVTEELFQMGATVVAIGRSPTRLAKLASQLLQENDEPDRFIPILADLNDLASVSKAANEILKSRNIKHIDFLINNAGMHYGLGAMLIPGNPKTQQGYDQVFGVNYLSHFLLTEKLIPLLKKSPHGGRIIQVSSSFHWLANGLQLEITPAERKGLLEPAPYASRGNAGTLVHKARSYQNSKLAQILHTRSLNKKNKKVKAVSLCPSWVGTNIGGNGILSHILKLFAYPSSGYGKLVVFNAMFDPLWTTTKMGDEKEDYFISNELFDFLPHALLGENSFLNAWFRQSLLRDGMVWIIAVSVLFTQKFFPDQVTAKSSPESYNTTLQDSLFVWSKDAVSGWV